MTSEEYEKYLQTPEWKKLKEARLLLDGNCCVLCASTEDLECHHRHYKTLGYENPITDLATLCKEHHDFYTSYTREKRYKLQNGKRIAPDVIRETPGAIVMQGEKDDRQSKVQDYRRVTPTYAQQADSRSSQ